MDWLLFFRDLLFVALGVSILACLVVGVAAWAGFIEITGCSND